MRVGASALPKLLLVERRAKHQPDCPYVCFRLERKRHAVEVQGFRKAWYSACIRAGLGKMEPEIDRVTGEPIYAHPRGPRSKPKVKMVYKGMTFHDTRRSGARNLVRASPSGLPCPSVVTRRVPCLSDTTSSRRMMSPKQAASWSFFTAGKSGTIRGQTAPKCSRSIPYPVDY